MSKYVLDTVVRCAESPRGHPRAWLIGQGFPTLNVQDRGARVSQPLMPTLSDILDMKINVL